jgi:hypothetical protein
MQPSADPRPTLKLTTDAFLLADTGEHSQARLERFLNGQARQEELEAFAAIGDEPYEITTDAMLAQLDAYQVERAAKSETSKVLKTIRIMLAARKS